MHFLICLHFFEFYAELIQYYFRTFYVSTWNSILWSNNNFIISSQDKYSKIFMYINKFRDNELLQIFLYILHIVLPVTVFWPEKRSPLYRKQDFECKIVSRKKIELPHKHNCVSTHSVRTWNIKYIFTYK